MCKEGSDIVRELGSYEVQTLLRILTLQVELYYIQGHLLTVEQLFDRSFFNRLQRTLKRANKKTSCIGGEGSKYPLSLSDRF